MAFKPFALKQAFGYDTLEESKKTWLMEPGVSMTQQHMAEDCDINVILKRFGLTGQMPTAVRAPTYGDFTGVSDYREALDAIMLAEESFMEMPADVRFRFQNDPALFVDFCSDPKNADAMAKMGLLSEEAMLKRAAELVAAAPDPRPPAVSPSPPASGVSPRLGQFST